MTKYRWRAILIQGSYEDIKSPMIRNTILRLIPTLSQALSMLWKSALASRLSIPPVTDHWLKKRPQAGYQNISLTGIWKKMDLDGFYKKEIFKILNDLVLLFIIGVVVHLMLHWPYIRSNLNRRSLK
jgi:hypothetical protein